MKVLLIIVALNIVVAFIAMSLNAAYMVNVILEEGYTHRAGAALFGSLFVSLMLWRVMVSGYRAAIAEVKESGKGGGE